MRVAITGATGYIGQRLIRAARLAGHEVLALSRRPVIDAGVMWQPFDLADTVPPTLPSNIDAVFHLAAVTRYPSGAELSEQNAAKMLIAAAASVRATFIFVSSQTARPDAPTAYGRNKWKIERATIEAGGLVIRPGQVYGGPEDGLFGLLCRQVRRLPVLPAFVPAPTVQPVHVDDLVEGLLSCLTRKPATVISLAASEDVSFTTYLHEIARGRTTRFPLFVPVPVLLIHIISRVVGSRLSSRLGLEQLRSLFALRHMNTTDDLQSLELTLRSLSAGMTRSGYGRRALIREGRVLLMYMLRTKPAGALVRRYVRAVETLRVNLPLNLPELCVAAPALIALIDGAKNVDMAFRSEFDWRINAALMISEASPQGAQRFLDIENTGSWIRGAAIVAQAGLMELGIRILRLFLMPLVYMVGRRGVFR